MRTTLKIDDRTMKYVLEITGEKTKTAAVNAALKEFVRRQHVQELIDSFGKIIVDDYSEEMDRADRRRREFLDSLRNGTA